MRKRPIALSAMVAGIAGVWVGGAHGQPDRGAALAAEAGDRALVRSAPSVRVEPDAGALRRAPVRLLAAEGSPAWHVAERVVFPRPDVARLRAEDWLASRAGEPRRVGVNLGLGAVVDRASVWTEEAGGWVWRQALVADGARAVRVWFDRLEVPPRSVVRVGETVGAVAVHEVVDHGPDRVVWSPLLSGETALVEIWVPVGGGVEDVSVEVGGIAHVYGDLASAPTAPGVGGGSPAAPVSGIGQVTDRLVSCSEPVLCSDLGPIFEDVSAVGRMCYSRGSGQFVCTGTLINDLDDETDRRLFLTAEHCIGTQSEADSLVVTWDYESPACNSTVPLFGVLEQSEGATLLLAESSMDTTLLELREPLQSSRVLSGWSTRVPRNNEVLRGLHHPGGGPKEYARYSVAESSVSFVGISRADYHFVRPEEGAIRGGSSGSGLFNEDGLLIGVASFTAVVADELTDMCVGSSSARVPAGFGRFDRAFPLLEPFLEASSLPDGNTAPVVAGVSLTPDSVRTGEMTPVLAVAFGVSDADGLDDVSSVRFFVDRDADGVRDTTEIIGVDGLSSDGFSVSFDAGGLGPGVYTVSAVAVDSDGAESFAATTEFTVTPSSNGGGTLDPGDVGVFVSNSPPKPLPSRGTELSTIVVPDDVCIADVDVSVDIAHTEVSDLIVEVISPSGDVVRLHDRSDFGESDLDRFYNDDGRGPDGPGVLADFDGEQSIGVWTLRVEDAGSLGLGAILGWSLTIEAGAPGCEPSVRAPGVSSVAADPGRVREGSGASVRVEATVRAGTRPVRSVTFAIDTNGNGLIDDAATATDRSASGGWTGRLDAALIAAGTYDVLAVAEDSSGLRGEVARSTLVVTPGELIVQSFEGRVGVTPTGGVGSVLVSVPGGAAAPGEAGAVEVISSDSTGTGGGTATPSQVLRSSGGSALDLFGTSVSRDGGTLAVGAPGDDTAGPDAGAVYVFELTESGWVERQRLTGASDDSEMIGTLMGSAVSVHGGVLVAGSPGAPGGGSVEVFEADGSGTFEWVTTLSQTGLVGSAGRFGQSVSVWAGGGGATLVVGAPAAGARGVLAGEAFVYRRSGVPGDGAAGAWGSGERLVPEAGAAGDYFGGAVAVEAELIAVGARGADGAAGSGRDGAGEVAVFRLVDGALAFEDTLRAPGGGEPGQALGASVAIGFGQIAAGGPGVSVSAGVPASDGVALVFDREGTEWAVAERVDGSAPGFGLSVGFGGADLLVGFASADGSGVVALEDVIPPSSLDLSPASGRIGQEGFSPACARLDLASPWGIVDVVDVVMFTRLYARGNGRADLNDDGRVDVLDVEAFATARALGCIDR